MCRFTPLRTQSGKCYIFSFCLYSKHTLIYSYDSQFDQYIWYCRMIPTKYQNLRLNIFQYGNTFAVTMPFCPDFPIVYSISQACRGSEGVLLISSYRQIYIYRSDIVQATRQFCVLAKSPLYFLFTTTHHLNGQLINTSVAFPLTQALM